MAKFSAHLPRSPEPSQPALSYEHIENFTKDLEVRRDLGKMASPVNRAHMKRPLLPNRELPFIIRAQCRRGCTKEFAILVNRIFPRYWWLDQ